MKIRAAAARKGSLLVLSLMLWVGGNSLLAQEPPPEPPTPPVIDPDDMDMPEPPRKEISLKQITVREGETHRGDISAVAPSGSIEGTQDGDLYLWSGPLRISGTVTGDVFYFGSQLDVTGKVDRSIRAMSGNVVIDGEVGGNVFAPSGSLVIGSKGHVKGNVTCLGGQLVHSGVVDGTLKFTGGNLILRGKVLEDAEIEADSIQIEKGARIEGDVEYSSRTRIDDELKAITGGDVDFNDEPNVKRVVEEEREGSWLPTPTKIFFRMLFFCAAFLFGCALLALFGNYEAQVVNAIRTDALRCAGVGFVSFLVTIAVVLSLILIITVIFVPIYLILYLVAAYLAKIPVALWIGRSIFERFDKKTGPYLALLVGLVVLYTLFMIPYLGFIIWCGVILLGLGAMISAYLAFREAKKAATAMPPAGGPPAETPIAS